MILDETIARDRAWAVPALCALMIFHHDFTVPRLAQVQQLSWSDGALGVRLCYGICNVSGTVIDATDFVVTLRREGVVGMYVVQNDLVDSKQTLVEFLTGEVWRESKRWNEDMLIWNEQGADLDEHRAAILSMVSALVAYPEPVAHIIVDKDLTYRNRLKRIRVSNLAADFEITPAGFRSAILYIYLRLPNNRAGGFYRHYDVQTTPTPGKPRCLRLLNRATVTSARLALLPMDLIVHLFERLQPRENFNFLTDADPPTTCIIDATAGDNLSALFN